MTKENPFPKGIEYFQNEAMLFAPIKCWKGKKGCTNKTSRSHGMCPRCLSRSKNK